MDYCKERAGGEAEFKSTDALRLSLPTQDYGTTCCLCPCGNLFRANGIQLCVCDIGSRRALLLHAYA